VRIRLVKVVDGVGLYEAPRHLVYAEPLYVVYKAGGKVDAATTKVLYDGERWLMPLPAEEAEVELIYVGSVESLRG
jgi:hypothetical protein